jgi:cell division protein FtsL
LTFRRRGVYSVDMHKSQQDNKVSAVFGGREGRSSLTQFEKNGIAIIVAMVVLLAVVYMIYG